MSREKPVDNQAGRPASTRPAQGGEPPEFARLGDAVERFVRNLGGPPISVLSRIAESWGEIVGPALVDHTRVIELVDGVLVVGCDDGMWASQVGWMQAQIIDNFHRVLGDDGPRFEVLVHRVVARVEQG